MQSKANKDKNLTSRLVGILVASLVTMGVTAHSATKRPQLVVGIMVEGLNDDYLELLRDHFGENGFKLLIDKSLKLDNVEFGYGIDPTAATAMVMTGTTPSVNGIVGATIYNPETRKAIPILHDKDFVGNFTTETYSPNRLTVSTLSDEVRISDAGVGHVYAIAPDPQSAIIMAGHAGNSGVWINDVDGKWSTTTFYKDMPPILSRRNYSMPLSTRLDTLSWRPSLALDRYPDLPEHKKMYPFNHRFGRNDRDRYRAFKRSASVNTEVTDVATDYLTAQKLGTKGVTDMLNIYYTLTPYQYTRDADNRIETQDAYIKLDGQLARLFKAIKEGAGLDNTVVFLTGIPSTPSYTRDDPKWNIPYGEFSPRKAISLVNMYLIALHGNGEWVSGYHAGHFYLNQKLIKERDLNMQQIRTEAAEFIGRMSGISRIYTIDDILAGRIDQADTSLRRNTSLGSAGDIIIRVAPGWEVVEDDSIDPNDKGYVGQVSRLAAPASTAFIMAPGVAANTVTTPVDACVIAPTVARILRIRSPNGASMTPMGLR